MSAISKPPAPDRFQSDRLFVLFFADRLSPEHAGALLQRYRAGLRQELDALEERERVEDPGETAGRKFVRDSVCRCIAPPSLDLDENAEDFADKLPQDAREVAG